MEKSQDAEINQLKAKIEELEKLEIKDHEKQKEIDLKLSNLEKGLSSIYNHLRILDDEINRSRSIYQRMKMEEKFEDAEINKLKAKIAELVKLIKKNDAQKEKNMNQSDRINKLESKIIELGKQIEMLGKKSPSAEVSDPYQFEVHAGAIVDSIRLKIVIILLARIKI